MPGRHWGFDRVTLQGARALGAPRTPPPPFLRGPLPEMRTQLVELDDLVRFAEHPIKAFLRQRLGVWLGDHEDEVNDSLAVELTHLERYSRRSAPRGPPCRARTSTPASRRRSRAACRRPSGWATWSSRTCGRRWTCLATSAFRFTWTSPRSLDVKVELGDGRILSGTVQGVVGDLLRVVQFSRARAKHRSRCGSAGWRSAPPTPTGRSAPC